MKPLSEKWKIFLLLFFSPDVAMPSVSAYDNEDQMLTFVKSQLNEIAKRKGINQHLSQYFVNTKLTPDQSLDWLSICTWSTIGWKLAVSSA